MPVKSVDGPKERLTLTIVEAAAVLGIGRNTCYELARTGRLPILRLGKRIVVPKEALERLLADAGKDGQAKATEASGQR